MDVLKAEALNYFINDRLISMNFNTSAVKCETLLDTIHYVVNRNKIYKGYDILLSVKKRNFLW